jgi:hypothetical protein
VIVFGGLGHNGTVLGDTWKYSARIWTQLNITPAASPSPRAYAAMAYDPRSQSLLLFGGLTSWPPTNAGKLNDTWLFQNGHWKQLHPPSSPKARYAAAMTYDYRDGYMLLFGGNTTWGPYADTWDFSLGTWTKVATSPTPTPRYGAGITYDWAVGYVVMTNGRGLGTPSNLYTNTWTYKTGAWAHWIAAPFWAKPVYRLGAAIASSPSRNASNLTLLAGGSACPTCHPAYHLINNQQYGSGQFDQMFFYLGRDRWVSDYPLTPVASLNTEFPVLAYDILAGCFVYLVDGQTWVYR